MAVKQIKSLVQFSRGTSIALNELTTPIPDGVVIFAIDDGSFRLGDGVSKYNELTTLFTYADLVSAQGGISNRFEDPTIDQNGKIAVVEFDSIANKVKYGVSETSLSSLLDSITALEANDVVQTDAIATILAKALSIDVSINTANDNSVIVINSRRYASSGMTLSGVQNQIASQVTYVPGSHLEEVNFYTTQDKKFTMDKLNLDDNSYCYVDIVGFNNLVGFGTDPETSLVYGLTAANSNVVTEQISGSLFKVTFNNVTSGVKDNVPVVLIASVDNVSGTSKIEKAVACLVKRQKILVGVYGGSGSDQFHDIIVDLDDNIFCCGQTTSEGLGGIVYGDALIVKFDKNFNIIARKRYGGASDDVFYDIAVDSSNNIICCGSSFSEGTGSTSYTNALVIKFDNDLNILTRKIYSGAYNDYFVRVATDSSNNIICIGNTGSEYTGGGNASCIIIKFDTSLNILFRKTLYTANIEFFEGIALDSNGNIFVVGRYSAGGETNYLALIVKFDPSLNLLIQKTYGGVTPTNSLFYNICIDESNNVYACGGTNAVGSGATDMLITKFDNNLNVISSKVYGTALEDLLRKIAIDDDGNLVCVGWSSSLSGFGSFDGIIIKFDPLLNVIYSKRFGGSGSDYTNSIDFDKSNNIFVSVNTTSEGFGTFNGGIVRLPKDPPLGTFTGSILSGLSIRDTNDLVLGNANLTLATGTLTLTNSALTLSDSTLTLADSTLTLTVDTFN